MFPALVPIAVRLDAIPDVLVLICVVFPAMAVVLPAIFVTLVPIAVVLFPTVV